MSGIAGKGARIAVSVTSGGAGTYYNVAGIKSFSHEISGQSVDDSEFTVNYMQRILGILDGKYSLSGNLRVADTNGQLAIRAALIAGSELWVKVLPDNAGTANAGVKQQVIVTKFAEDASVEGGVGVSIELEGTGAIALV